MGMALVSVGASPLAAGVYVHFTPSLQAANTSWEDTFQKGVTQV
jgi:hypothetical protein